MLFPLCCFDFMVIFSSLWGKHSDNHNHEIQAAVKSRKANNRKIQIFSPKQKRTWNRNPKDTKRSEFPVMFWHFRDLRFVLDQKWLFAFRDVHPEHRQQMLGGRERLSNCQKQRQIKMVSDCFRYRDTK